MADNETKMQAHELVKHVAAGFSAVHARSKGQRQIDKCCTKLPT